MRERRQQRLAEKRGAIAEIEKEEQKVGLTGLNLLVMS